ncbi:platelet binding protein GspB-like isoform X2 [Hetaerina americana]|uniref:platelet binding protein GspB-like isoform X2 n=1 Tax=Hetaerina americana TaxID=62018 RepID=UPI003A7F13E3
MAKEVIARETVGAIEDDGPEEGEIEDDTSEEDRTEKKFSSSKSTDVLPSVGMKYYQPSSSSKSESHTVKPKVYPEEKKHSNWRNPKRRIYYSYIDHDKPSRDTYSRLTKSDLNSDHREINFHELLKDYRTSKHGNEDFHISGNSHEKENRHYSKEARTDPPRNRESGTNESPEDKLKRNRKRKQHRSPSNEQNDSVSSDTEEVRKKRDLRNARQKKNRKVQPRNWNIKESAALFAKIRASKLKAAAASEQHISRVDGVQSDNEKSPEVSVLELSDLGSVGSKSTEGKCTESRGFSKEGQDQQKGTCKIESSKSVCSASDSQAADKNEDSESKDEEDDVNQLRMIALQSAIRAKYLERKRRGIIVRRQARRMSNHVPSKKTITDSSFNLDDTADLLEAAVEEAVSSSASKEAPPSATENWLPTMFSSLSDVPLPPDDPPIPSAVEDLTPVDMELALTDEEENANPYDNDGNSLQSENLELLHPRVRSNRSQSKVRSIPVTIGSRAQSSKSRKRMMSSTLLEVRTCTGEGQVEEDLNSGFVSMADVNLDSMILLDEVGICSSPEVGPRIEEEQVLSEASEAKSDLVQCDSNQACFSGSFDDEDEEVLRAKLLIDISRRHISENINANTIVAEEIKGSDLEVANPSVNEVITLDDATEELETLMRPGERGVVSPATNLQAGRGVKLSLKRSAERSRRGQLLARVRNRQVGMPSNVQLSVTPYAKSYLSKIASRGKYQRINQNRIVGGKKRIDGNLHVTVVGTVSKAKTVSTVPQKQDRIVICLGDDSDESDDERQNTLSKKYSPVKNPPLPSEKSLVNPVETSELLAICNETNSAEQPILESQFPVVANVSADFEKSVDRFLKEVRSGQESRLQDEPSSRGQQSKMENIAQKQINLPGSGVKSGINVTSLRPRVNSKANVKSAVPALNFKASMTPVTPKVAGNIVKTKLERQIVKTVSGVTPQAVRHLPPPQQEEYRRLKMQISVLEELRKKRKAAAALNAAAKCEKAIEGKKCDSVGVSDAPKLVVQQSQLQKSNPANELSANGDAGKSLDSRKATTPMASATNTMSTNDDDDVEEDVNLLREQLLKSRLHKKMNAMAEKSALKSDVLPGTKETIACGPSVALKDAGFKLQAQENTPTSLNFVSKLSSESVDQMQKSVSTLSKGIPCSDKLLETASSSAPHVERLDPLKNDSPKNIASVSMKCSKAEESIGAKGDAVVPCASKAMECHTADKVPLGDTEITAEVVGKVFPLTAGGGEKVENNGGLGGGGISEGKMAATQASFVSPRYNLLMSGDSRVTELAELELQLLSERHAALQCLGELSNLLTKMEIEGAQLRQKEMAAQKLRKELANAEMAIAAKKGFLKQLALTISSTHERVTSTRQRCSMLCQACTKLGNKLKQAQEAAGGKVVGYQVPSGGAALVKSQLSSVLWQTKQMKKAGLPFLRGQNFVPPKHPMPKRPPRRVGTPAIPWSNLITDSIGHLRVSPSNTSGLKPQGSHIGSSVALGNNVSSANWLNNSPVFNPASKLKTQGNSTVFVPGKATGRKVPLSTKKFVLAPAKLFVPSSFSAASSTAVASGDSAKIKLPALSEKRTASNENGLATTSASVAKVVTPLSQSTKSGASGAAVNSDPVPSKVVSSFSGEKTVSMQSVAGNGVQLRDYHSPLEPVTNRTHAENTSASSGSSLQLGESVMLDPNIILCPYELMGECQDEECHYQHERSKGVVKGS